MDELARVHRWTATLTDFMLLIAKCSFHYLNLGLLCLHVCISEVYFESRNRNFIFELKTYHFPLFFFSFIRASLHLFQRLNDDLSVRHLKKVCLFHRRSPPPSHKHITASARRHPHSRSLNLSASLTSLSPSCAISYNAVRPAGKLGSHPQEMRELFFSSQGKQSRCGGSREVIRTAFWNLTQQ